MQKFKTLSAFVLIALEIAILPSAANAGGMLGSSNQISLVPEMNYGSGTVIGAAPGVVNPIGLSGTLGNSNGINVQSNINVSNNINASSNISVNDSINGSEIDYGLNGANVMNAIDDADNFAASVSSNASTSENSAIYGDLEAALEADALLVLQPGN